MTDDERSLLRSIFMARIMDFKTGSMTYPDYIKSGTYEEDVITIVGIESKESNTNLIHEILEDCLTEVMWTFVVSK